MLVDGTGLQLYVPRNQPVGHYAKHVVREDLIRRLRQEIADQPDKLARLEEQIERMDTEAAASRRGFLSLAQRSQADREDFVEVNGQMLAERDLFEQQIQQGAQQGDELDVPAMIAKPSGASAEESSYDLLEEQGLEYEATAHEQVSALARPRGS
jgi:phage shock protein A